MARVIRNFDDGDGNISKDELQHGLRSYLGFGMDDQDFSHVWDYFDKDGSGAISVAEFLHGIRGNLNNRRLNAVLEAFEKIDRDSTGQISMNEIEALYDVSHHPKVLTGEWSRKDALADFLQQWDRDTNGEVSKEEFLDYFKDISLGIEADEEFLHTMRDIFPAIAPPERNMNFDHPQSPALSQAGGRRSAAGNTPDGTVRFSNPPSPFSQAGGRERSSAGNTPDASLSAGRLARARRRQEQIEKEEKLIVPKEFTLTDRYL